jgi:hypothetical protein
MNESTHLPWDEGLPTAPDVEELLKAFPELKVGDRVQYEEIEALLKIAPKSNRFKTVTSAWRKRLAQQKIIMESDPGFAFYVASSDQITAGTHGTLKFIGRKARRQRRKLAAATAQEGADLALIEHHGRLMNAVEKDTRKHRMNLLPGTAVPNQPRTLPTPENKELQNDRSKTL